MTRDLIKVELDIVFRDVLDDDSISLSDSTVAEDIEEWDSINHIQLVVQIEKRYKIRFKAAEIQSWENIGEIIDSIIRKLE
jgi:acyl carrier protein